jgi:hypothetical protein
VDLAAQDRQLVAQHDDLDGELVLAVPREPDQLGDADEEEVEERERHGAILAVVAPRPKVLLVAADGILGTGRNVLTDIQVLVYSGS